MRWQCVGICLAMSSVAEGVETMRIALAQGDAEVNLAAPVLGEGADAEEAPFRLLASGRARVNFVKGRLTVDGAAVVGDAVRFRAGAGAMDAGVPGHDPIRVGTREVRGDVVIRVHAGALQTVNVLPLEDYLVAVLGSEMPRTFPDQALRAQAVSARTYALRKKVDNLGEPFYLGAGVLSQMYEGLRHEDERTRDAVLATRGEVLTFDLEPIEAYFHASCGGRTESGLAALNRDLPYLKPVECPCGGLASSHWDLWVPPGELETVLGVKSLGGLSVTSRTDTGRARLVALAGGRTLDAVTLRKRLGYQRFKSLAFDIEAFGGEGAVHFVGKGYGHGAGMCQWGAKTYAEQGWDYRRILSHYYPGTELQTLY